MGEGGMKKVLVGLLVAIVLFLTAPIGGHSFASKIRQWAKARGGA